MTAKNDSKKQMIKSSSIIGGASSLTILIGIVKVKALALLLGPAGIGFMGILMAILSTGTVLFGMGLGTSGVRELALSNKSIEKLERVRKALFSANILLGTIAIILTYIFKEKLSELFFQDTGHQGSILIIAFGIFFSLICRSQTTLLQGFRKIADLAKVNVISASVASVLGILIILQLGEQGLPYFAITSPFITCIVAFFYTKQLPKLKSSYISFKQLKPQWHSLITMGFVLMLTGFMSSGCQLVIRHIINQELNIESVGYFQAAWSISMTYISFVLGAMAADYYPRLTQKITNQNDANLLVNEQTEIAIIFAAPVLLGMLAFAPLVINLLYSSEFIHSVEILRWQVFGDVIKVISWPIGFIILAKGHSKVFFCTELIWNTSYILFVYFGIGHFGIEVTGYAFSCSYFIYLIVVVFVSSHINSFKWTRHNIHLIILLSLSSVCLLLISYLSLLATMLLGFIFVTFSANHAFKTLSELEINNKKMVKILNLYKTIRAKLGLKKLA